jgi:hypothetical protein
MKRLPPTSLSVRCCCSSANEVSRWLARCFGLHRLRAPRFCKRRVPGVDAASGSTEVAVHRSTHGLRIHRGNRSQDKKAVTHGSHLAQTPKPSRPKHGGRRPTHEAGLRT